jgi:hypothetical protein
MAIEYTLRVYDIDGDCVDAEDITVTPTLAYMFAQGFDVIEFFAAARKMPELYQHPFYFRYGDMEGYAMYVERSETHVTGGDNK